MNLADMPQEAHDFLSQTRIGHLVTNAEPWPQAMAVWYNWTGTEIEFFSRGTRPKNKRLVDNPLASFVVSAEVAESPYWVAIDGQATVHEMGGAELMDKLYPRYYPLDNPENVARLEAWTPIRDTFQRITLSADRVRHFVG